MPMKINIKKGEGVNIDIEIVHAVQHAIDESLKCYGLLRTISSYDVPNSAEFTYYRAARFLRNPNAMGRMKTLSGISCDKCGTFYSAGSVCPVCDQTFTRADLDKAVAEEREACALECEFLDEDFYQGRHYGSVGHRIQRDQNKRYAEAIRNRGKK